MKPILIAGNWKSNKTTSEAIAWLHNFQFSISNFQLQNIYIVLCVPFTLLHSMKEEIDRLQLPIVLGAQDVSQFSEGAYTGAVSARQVKEFAGWVIIGHSERRKYFGETDSVLDQKVTQAKTAGLRILYCVSDENTVIPDGADAAAYEPIGAIGTGKADTPDYANTVITAVKAKSQVRTVLYGGSVTPDNASLFLAQPAIDGVLVGGASLDAHAFAVLLRSAML